MSEEKQRDWGVYLLVRLDGRRRLTYVGATPDLPARVEKHNRGRGAKFTSGGVWTPVIWITGFTSKRAALSFESGWRLCGRRRVNRRFRVLEQCAPHRLRYNRDVIRDRLLDLLWFTSCARRWDHGFRRDEKISAPVCPSEILTLHLSLLGEHEYQNILQWPWCPMVLIAPLGSR